MVKIKIVVKGKGGEQADISIDPQRSCSLLMRKVMMALSTGEAVTGFKGENGREVDLEKTVLVAEEECGATLIALYGDDEPEPPTPALTSPPPAPAASSSSPQPPASPSGMSSSPSSSSSSSGAPTNQATLPNAHAGKAVAALAFSPSDPSLLASGGYDGNVVLWEVGSHVHGGGAKRKVGVHVAHHHIHSFIHSFVNSFIHLITTALAHSPPIPTHRADTLGAFAASDRARLLS